MMVDNVPLGMKGELRPALRHLRRKYPHSRIHLNLRDILDDAQTIRSSWRQTGTDLEIDELFDAINVFGCREIYDSQAEYGLPAERTQFLGYIGPRTQTALPEPAVGEGSDVHTVLVTVGGGGTARRSSTASRGLQGELGAASPFHFIVVTGPLMDTALRHGLTAQLAGQPGVEVHEYLPRFACPDGARGPRALHGRLQHLCEVMGHARRSIVVPRQYPRREQLIRAEALAARAVLRVLPMDRLDPGSLRDMLERSLVDGPAITDADLPSLGWHRRPATPVAHGTRPSPALPRARPGCGCCHPAAAGHGAPWGGRGATPARGGRAASARLASPLKGSCLPPGC